MFTNFQIYCNISSSVWRTCFILVGELSSLPDLKLLSFIKSKSEILPTPAVARSKAWVSGHSLAEIVVSNPAGGMVVYFV